jgi:hypothetical protein
MNRILTSLLALAMLTAGASVSFGVPSPRWCAAPLKTGKGGNVTLGGFLSEKVVWGPPNFGENPKTDSRVSIWVLSLDYPIPVSINGEFKTGHEVSLVDKIQLNVTSEHVGDLRSHSGYRIVITGSLWSAFAPTDLKPVTMNIAKIEPVGSPPPTCDGRKTKRSI